ncbi:glycosyltransferase family 2 protein [Seonamhaeicola algicola]|uniref:Glycosyltransferase family 2 protein n=1 Tax=Seonamhaeicola algicola TaxID=1719036 RepID=A0A5C7B2G0_9FLAO|nr:glycosyltransferase [Seonamhaeicola algicola]TXE12032.1 glycosyltransferase family 2 protein [Seonamhaeicola algicola]
MIEASILIVSKDRRLELEKTISILETFINKDKCELLVFLDGCRDDSIDLKEKYPWVLWKVSGKNIGASKARNKLYKQASGEILIGLDDDAHPLQENFIEEVKGVFKRNEKIGVIAFKEIRGVFKSNKDALNENIEEQEYLCNEFVGCGFAIKKTVYNSTKGFPIWMDIYGEETCVSIEVINKGYDILYTSAISVNHRVDSNLRKKQGNNYFRFGRQLRNSGFYFLVYYKYPLKSILKLFVNNFIKYAILDLNFFKTYLVTVFVFLIKFPKILLNHRQPVTNDTLKKKRALPLPGK